MIVPLDIDNIVLFKTPTGRYVHVQYGVVYRDLLNREVTQDEMDESNQSLVGWVMYERLFSVCKHYSTNGINDPNRGVVQWCRDIDLCRGCLNRLSEKQRQAVFKTLTSRVVEA